jgi:hypothetical protein
MWQLLVVAFLVSAAPEVRIARLDGTVITGTLVDLQSDGLTMAVQGEPQSQPRSELLAIVPTLQNAPASTKSTVQVKLIDGSQLSASTYQASSGTATVGVLGRDPIPIPTRSVRWVRLGTADASLDQQWNTILARSASGDVLVFRRGGGNLDYLEGTLGAVGDEAVHFTFDGDTVSVPRSRLEGFVHYVPAADRLPEVICHVEDVHGSLWHASAIGWADGRVTVQTPAGATVAWLLPDIEKLDFSQGNILYLSDLEPREVQWTPFLPSPAVSGELSKLFQPRRDQSFGGGKLQLRFTRGGRRVEEFEKGLAIHTRTQMLYYLPDGFRQLVGLAGIDARAGERGSVQLELVGDQHTLLRAKITGEDEPLPVQVDISGVRRLTIVVDFADDLAIADQLNLCNLRITK